MAAEPVPIRLRLLPGSARVSHRVAGTALAAEAGHSAAEARAQTFFDAVPGPLSPWLAWSSLASAAPGRPANRIAEMIQETADA